MSGFVAAPPLESGLPPLTATKWVPPTSRAAKIRFTPPTVSDQEIHGTVGCPAVMVPAAIVGSSALADGERLTVQRSSVVREVRHGPAPLTEVSSTCGPGVRRPKASHWNPPSITPDVVVPGTARAAKTRSFRTPK